MADIVVLGAGVCGLASAALLSEEGHDVVVLEWDRTGR
jgi:phytoene dehydrogenase-like protein